MAKLLNLARMTTATTGTGTITLGSAVSGFLSFAAAGIADQDIVAYAIKDGANSEIGFGTYTAAGTTLTRNVTNSTNSNNAISLSGSAEVFITPRAQDLLTQADQPGGRLTLVTGTPVMNASQGGKNTVFYTPYRGNYVPIYDGFSFVPTEFTELSQLTTDTTKSPAAVVAEACYDMFVWNDAGTIRCTRGPAWIRQATITVTIASPAVVSWASNPLTEGQPVVFTTTGALPTGITAGTTYYVTKAPGASSFNISTSIANSSNGTSGTRVNTSGSQSGVHTATNRTTDRGTGAGTSELQMIKGIWTNKNAITNGPAANRGTYVGTIRTNASSLVDFQYGGAGAPPVAGFLHVWNCYNRVRVHAGMCDDQNVSYTYTTNATRAQNNQSTMRLWWTLGLVEDMIWHWSWGDVQAPGTLATAPVGRGHNVNDTAGGIQWMQMMYVTNEYRQESILGFLHPFDLRIGSHFVSAVEVGDGTNATSFRSDNDNLLTMILWM